MKKNNKKRIIALIIAALLLINIIAMIVPLFSVNAAKMYTTALNIDNQVVFYSAPEVTIMYNDNVVACDTPPVIMEDRTLVPVRAVFEKIGSAVSWDASERKVNVTGKGKDIVLFIDNNVATVNNEAYTMDVTAKIINNRTYVPLRFIAEHSGLNVNWDGNNYVAKMFEPTDNEIKNITYSNSGDNFVVRIDGTSEMNYSHMTLSDPERLVIDFKNAFLKFGNITMNENEYVSGMRYSQFSLSPNTVRVVFDIKDITKFKIEKNGTQLMIIFGTDVESAIPEINESETKEPEVFVPASSVDGIRVVVLDPGHGGSDPGAIGKDAFGNEVLQEKDPNLAIALIVEQRLLNAGVTVYMTRKDDTYVTLSGRYNYANGKNADLFCSIHNNASENFDLSGTMTMYAYDEAKEGYTISGKEYASIMQKHMVKALGSKDLKARKNSALAVVRGTNMPAVITESLFVSNEGDRNRLLDSNTLSVIANAIADGILEVLEKIEC
ncbi:MAG: N-acetylmuramoyl-L-alanine amidase [Clostridia bacterium]|nr:N-acetylmuramoyl-L-alanine amidase [Clostridia bacterium]